MSTASDRSGDGFGRRRFLANTSALGAASLLGLPRTAASEPPPEITTLRVKQAPFLCEAPVLGASPDDEKHPAADHRAGYRLTQLGGPHDDHTEPVTCDSSRAHGCREERKLMDEELDRIEMERQLLSASLLAQERQEEAT